MKEDGLVALYEKQWRSGNQRLCETVGPKPPTVDKLASLYAILSIGMVVSVIVLAFEASIEYCKKQKTCLPEIPESPL
jgi:hypothetical protein